jgi:signal transduction histidine kinase
MDDTQAALELELSDVRSQLRAAEAQLRDREVAFRELSTELADTNQGVLALYAELEDAAIRLKDASDLKSRFLSYMSHEFKTPLASIRSMARLLLDRIDGPLSDAQQKQVSFIQGSAVELSEMVEDLLDLARVDAGRVKISPAWFEIVDLFSTLRGMFKPLLSNDAVSLIFEEPPRMPRIYTDDKKLSQILRNFISNALKFTTHGEVRVTAAANGDGHATFAVSDTGIGIPADYLPALFQDFAQVDGPIQKGLRGTGLGLSLSRKLALLLGGDVAVRSQIAQGSTFSVTIPLTVPGYAPADDRGGAATERGRQP